MTKYDKVFLFSSFWTIQGTFNHSDLRLLYEIKVFGNRFHDETDNSVQEMNKFNTVRKVKNIIAMSKNFGFVLIALCDKTKFIKNTHRGLVIFVGVPLGTHLKLYLPHPPTPPYPL